MTAYHDQLKKRSSFAGESRLLPPLHLIWGSGVRLVEVVLAPSLELVALMGPLNPQVVLCH